MQRLDMLDRIKKGYRTAPVVALLGPRQTGKTTLAKTYFQEMNGVKAQYFDLENPFDLARLQDPTLALESMEGLIVIDEIQRRPDLFSIIRYLVDHHKKQRYLILGSASQTLINQSSESLAGRIHYLELTPFSWPEVDHHQKLWTRGGYPLSYLAKTDADSMQWRQDYIRTFLEQDIPNLGIKIPAEHLRRFWMMLAHYHGQTFNASEVGNSLDLSHHTVKRYLDILSGTFMMRQLPPWHENIAKRQVKSNKIYFRDSGLLHTLLNIPDLTHLSTHPKLGASWEGFALESIIRLQSDFECYFWGIHNQAELDLLLIKGSKRIGFEFKYSKTPALTKSMMTALKELKLDQLYVVYPGDIEFKLAPHIHAIGLEMLFQDV